MATSVTRLETCQDRYLWGCVRDMVHAHRVNKGEGLLWGILNVAVCVSTTAVLCRVVCFVVIRVVKCMHTNGGNFRQLV